MEESCFYQNVPCVIVKNRNFLKNKKLDDCGIILILRKWLEWIVFDKMFMNKELIKDKLYQIINQFKEKKIAFTKFYLILLNKIHPFYDKNCWRCKIYIKQCTAQKMKFSIEDFFNDQSAGNSRFVHIYGRNP